MTLRPGNSALNSILEKSGDHGKAEHLATCLLDFSSSLYLQAAQTADLLAKHGGLFFSITRRLSRKYSLLVNCALDLMLVGCYGEILRYCEDNDLASLFADALLYQATGCGPSTPSELAVRDEGTEGFRGLPKYAAARKCLGVADVEGWVFGKEYSELISGHRKDIAHIMAVQPMTILIRAQAKWTAGHFLFGILPTEEEQKNLQVVVRDYQRGLWSAAGK